LPYSKACSWLLALLLAYSSPSTSSPQTDRTQLRHFFQQRFPQISVDELNTGIYAFNKKARKKWQKTEQLAPYMDAVNRGKRLFSQPLTQNDSYLNCLGYPLTTIKTRFPRPIANTSRLQTLAEAINQCRIQHQLPILPWGGSEITSTISYLAFKSRGQPLLMEMPDNSISHDWYQQGKKHFYSRRGQLNLSCAACHIENSGNRFGRELLSPALGLISHYPAYRVTTKQLTSIPQRFSECFLRVGAAPLPLQSDEYKALEYFLGYIASGIKLNGPATRP
jgi:L-cysteine S-thiosulfotransferase